MIAGGGFAAWCLARALDRELESADILDATVVCPGACAPLTPWTHEVLAGRLLAEQAVVPWRDALRHVRFLLGRATRLGPDGRSLILDSPGVVTGCDPNSLAFDELVVATGFGAPVHAASRGSEKALPLRSPSHAIAVRNRLLDALAAASGEDSARRRRALLTVAVVGSDARAVAAAVETLGVLRESALFFPRVQREDPRVTLVSAGPLCASWGQRGASLIASHLASHGIEVRAGCRILEEADDHLMLEAEGGNRERVEVRTIISIEAGGGQSLLSGQPGATSEDGRAQIDEMLRVVGLQHVHALGACAVHPTTEPTPAAIARQAQWLAKAIAERAKGRAATALAGAPRVDAVSLGDGAGIARVGKRVVAGRAAGWIARATVRSVVPGIGRRISLCVGSWLEPLGVRQLVSRSGANPGSSRPLYLTPPPPPIG